MKVMQHSNHEFKPITLTITIESEEELNDLYRRMVVSAGVVNGDTLGFRIATGSRATKHSAHDLIAALNEYIQ